tara:strand:+ start:68 stop:337 length:270 start_codon:yes stop_codon:yes gene_type:complete
VAVAVRAGIWILLLPTLVTPNTEAVAVVRLQVLSMLAPKVARLYLPLVAEAVVVKPKVRMVVPLVHGQVIPLVTVRQAELQGVLMEPMG